MMDTRLSYARLATVGAAAVIAIVAWRTALNFWALLVPAAAPAWGESVPLHMVPRPVLDAVRTRFKDGRIAGAEKDRGSRGFVYEITLKDQGKNVDVTDSLKDYALQKLGKLDKHLNDAARLELEAYKSKRVAAADVVRVLTVGALPPPPDVLRAPSPNIPTLEPLEADRLEANRTTIGVLATLGGLVRAVGFFLPWIVLSGAQTENLSGAHGGAPILSIGLSIAIIVVALLYLSGRRETSPQLLRSLGLGALIASVFNFIYLSDQLGQLKAVLRAKGALVTASMGIGPWVQIVGAGIVFAVGIWAVRLERGRRPSRPRSYASPPPGPATTAGR